MEANDATCGGGLFGKPKPDFTDIRNLNGIQQSISRFSNEKRQNSAAASKALKYISPIQENQPPQNKEAINNRQATNSTAAQEVISNTTSKDIQLKVKSNSSPKSTNKKTSGFMKQVKNGIDYYNKKELGKIEGKLGAAQHAQETAQKTISQNDPNDHVSEQKHNSSLKKMIQKAKETKDFVVKHKNYRKSLIAKQRNNELVSNAENAKGKLQRQQEELAKQKEELEELAKLKENNNGKPISTNEIDKELHEINEKLAAAQRAQETAQETAQKTISQNDVNETTGNFPSKNLFHLRMLLLAFIVVFLGVIFTNALFYNKIFNEEKEGADFHSFDVSFQDKFKLLCAYIGAFMLTCLVVVVCLFIAILIIALVFHLITKETWVTPYVLFRRSLRSTSKVFLPEPFEMKNVKPCYIWLIFAAFVATFGFFALYAVNNKDFVTQMHFSEFKAGKDDENEQPPLAQPKLFLYHYGLMILVVFAVGLITTYLDEGKSIVLTVFFEISALLFLMLAIIYYSKVKSTGKSIGLLFLFIGIILGIHIIDEFV